MPSTPVGLDVLATVARDLQAAERHVRELRGLRDEWVVALARERVKHADIAEAADITPQAVGKVTRAAGVRRVRA
jgi:hypothetical protein